MPQLVQRLGSEHVGDHLELRQALGRGKEGATHDFGLGERRVRAMDLECGTAHTLLVVMWLFSCVTPVVLPLALNSL